MAKQKQSLVSETRSVRATVRVSTAFKALVSTPVGFRADGRRKWPLVVFLHGIGERGPDLSALSRHGLPRLVAEGRTFPFILLSPQCPEDGWWDAAAVDAFVGKMVSKLPVDPKRIYLTGLSMGGFGTWATAMYNPDRYAAIAPICGGGEVRHAAKLSKMPIWAFHGGKDLTVLPSRSQEMVRAVKAAGGTPKFTLYPSLEHNSWDRVYESSKFYDWLLAQRSRATSVRL